MTRNRNDITIFTQARKNSRRCPNKMLRLFAGSCLIDICLEKLDRFRNYQVCFGAAEEKLFSKAKAFSHIKVVKRSMESVNSHSNSKKIFQILKRITTPFVCWINPCHPFLMQETIEKAIDKFLGSSCRSLTSVVCEKGWYYDKQSVPLTNRSVQVDTVQSDDIYRVAHAFHIYERERMIKTGRPWDNKENDPYLFEIPLLQSLDIDSENEFIMVEALYNHYKHKYPEVLR